MSNSFIIGDRTVPICQELIAGKRAHQALFCCITFQVVMGKAIGLGQSPIHIPPLCLFNKPSVDIHPKDLPTGASCPFLVRRTHVKEVELAKEMGVTQAKLRNNLVRAGFLKPVQTGLKTSYEPTKKGFGYCDTKTARIRLIPPSPP